MLKRFLRLLLIVPCCLALPFAFKCSTQGFRLEKVRIAFPFRPDWEARTPSKIDLPQLCHGSFSYLAKGSQCYVFEHATEPYVLKIFRADLLHNRNRRWLRKLYATYLRQKPNVKTTRFIAKIQKTMSAAWLAYEQVPELTGVVYLHLNLTPANSPTPLPTISLSDRMGRSYRVPLDSVRFVIQKKGEPFRSHFSRCQHDPEQISLFFDHLLTLFVQRIQKKIINTDHNLSPNFGFTEHEALEIDFGNYLYSEQLSSPQEQRREFLRFAGALRNWTCRHAPTWLSHLDQKIMHIEAVTWPGDCDSTQP